MFQAAGGLKPAKGGVNGDGEEPAAAAAAATEADASPAWDLGGDAAAARA